MPGKLGLPAAAIACALAVVAPVVHPAAAAPAGSDTAPTTSELTSDTTRDPDGNGTENTGGDASGDTDTTSTPDETTTETTTDTTTVDTTTEPTTGGATIDRGAVVAPAAPLGPAIGNGSPTRGTQVQIVPPPPPPTTLAPWDPFLLPANSGWGRRVVYSKSKQTVWALNSNNVVIKQHRVSGRQTPLDPRPGTYHVWSRSRHTFSINNPSITWGYMVRFAKGAQGGNIGLHEIPYQYGRPVQSIWQLGQPLSGGCVRQWVGDAIWMWNWAHIGTKVVVTP